MKTKELYIRGLLYVFLAGIIPTIVLYMVGFNVLSVFEDVGAMNTILSIVTMVSPILASLIIAPLYLRNYDKESIDKLWKIVLIYGVVIIIILEVILYLFDPLWSGLGLIMGGLSSIVLALVAYFKKRKLL